ncbi:MAG: permease [Enterocloster clostridioformis]
MIAGFCLPVCDCASIPVFKSLVEEGVPMPAAVTFMLVSPVINPVVILSTWVCV